MSIKFFFSGGIDFLASDVPKLRPKWLKNAVGEVA